MTVRQGVPAMAADPRFGPDPDSLHPVPGHSRITFIRNLDQQRHYYSICEEIMIINGLT